MKIYPKTANRWGPAFIEVSDALKNDEAELTVDLEPGGTGPEGIAGITIDKAEAEQLIAHLIAIFKD
jgi:hypothetical protein